MQPPRVRTVVIVWAVIVAAALCCGVQITAQEVPPPPVGWTLPYAITIRTNVPEVLRGIPKGPSMMTTRAVEDCALTASEKQTKVCFSTWVVEPMSNAGIQTWVNCNGTARQTNEGGVVTIKANKGTLYKCVVDTPEGYGRRAFGAPGAEFQKALEKFTVQNGHVFILIEMLKR